MNKRGGGSSSLKWVALAGCLALLTLIIMSGMTLGRVYSGDNLHATIKSTKDKEPEFGQSPCHPTEGILDVESYYIELRPELNAIVRFDNVRQPTNFTDPNRTNISYFPSYPAPYPIGTGAGINTPTLVGNVLNHLRYKKFQSVPYTVSYFINISSATVSPTDERLSVFIKNIEDRGPNNLEHKRYQASLTKRVVKGRYQGHIKIFARCVHDSVVISKLPALSAFKGCFLDFFLNIHFGINDHPSFVRDFFNDFLYFVTTTDSNDVAAVRLMKGHMNTKCVREYVKGRIAVILSHTMTDTITWHFMKAGMPIETVTMECIHNIVAFAQFDNTFHLLVSQSMNPSVITPGTGGLSFFDLYRKAGAGVPLSFLFPAPYYNTTLYSGTPEQLKINVIREYFRIMLPNNLWFSSDASAPLCPGCSPHQQVRHIPQLIQIRAEYEKAGIPLPWSPAASTSTGWTMAQQLYGRYDPSRYSGPFMAAFSDAVYDGTSTSPAYSMSDETDAIVATINSMINSPIDNETTMLSSDASMIPVFAKPIYAPFGLGARRCPGEILNINVVYELLESLQCLKFYDDCVLNPSRCDPTSVDFTYRLVPLAPFKAMPDSLFVLSAVCA